MRVLPQILKILVTCSTTQEDDLTDLSLPELHISLRTPASGPTQKDGGLLAKGGWLARKAKRQPLCKLARRDSSTDGIIRGAPNAAD